MKRTCSFYSVQAEGNAWNGSISFEGGKLTPYGNVAMMEEIMGEPVLANRKSYDAKVDPQGWFLGLPQMYHGSRFYAQMDPGSMPAPFGTILRKEP